MSILLIRHADGGQHLSKGIQTHNSDPDLRQDDVTAAPASF